ncbi:hypothetical protein BDV12DRAFT_200455 [Aspergillus spectabilis]
MDDPARFNGISHASVRSHFESGVGPEENLDPSHPPAQKHACLVVDEEVLNFLADAKPVPEDESLEYKLPVDGGGTLKVPIRGLWRFWKNVSDPASMQELFSENGIYEA